MQNKAICKFQKNDNFALQISKVNSIFMPS